MEDVTPLMNEYRECVRHVWNTHVQVLAEAENDWDVRDGFNEVAARLFRLIVLRALCREEWEFAADHWADPKPFPFLHVVVERTCEIMVNREMTSGYWDDPVRVVEPEDLQLRFLQYFDWDDLGVRDWAFYRVRIVGSAKYPPLIGKDALLRVVGTNVRVLGEPAQPRGDADGRGA